MKSLKPVLLLAAFGLLLTLLLLPAVACGGGPVGESTPPAAAIPIPIPTPLPTPTSIPNPTSTPTPTPAPDPLALLDRAANRILAAEFLAFSLERQPGESQSGGASASPVLTLTRAEGTAQIPDRLRMALDIEVSGSFLKIGVIVVGDAAYMTDFFTGEWAPIAKEQVPFFPDNIAQTFASLIAGIDSPELVDAAPMEQGYTHHLRGTIPTVVLSQVFPGAVPETDLPVDVWVDEAGDRLPKALLTGKVAAGDAADTVRVLLLEVPESPEEIVAPPISPSLPIPPSRPVPAPAPAPVPAPASPSSR